MCLSSTRMGRMLEVDPTYASSVADAAPYVAARTWSVDEKREDGFCIFETAKDTDRPAINFPAVNKTVRTPSLVIAAVALGLPSMPTKDDTKFACPETP